MENKYDDPVFFEKYSQMKRSVEGLQSAGEWETLRSILPELADKRVLDLGCGYGWHCIYAAEQGAKAVTGLDISEKMLEKAREKTEDKRIEYIRGSIEEAKFPKNSFDVVLSSLALHYVEDFASVVDHVWECLRDNGEFVFTVEHPIFTAQGSQDWHYDRDGSIMHFPVDNYCYEGYREATFLGEKVVKYHRTITTYIETLLNKGFTILHVKEPQPPEHMMDIPGMKDEMRRPMMIAISARKAIS